MEGTILTQNRDETMLKMEKLLLVWIEDMTSKRIPLCFRNIQVKAISLYQDLQTDNAEHALTSFKASVGWFARFKKRVNLRNVKIHGEAASADENAAIIFVSSFSKLIQEQNYLPQQIFNVDETALFWKKMPSRSFVTKEMDSMPGYKAAKDRITLMIGGNLAGDLKLKPLVVYRAQKPRAFKNIDMKSLPVTWKHNSKGWVTRTIFTEWFKESFLVEVKRYCRDNEIPFKIILLLDNAPGHPAELDNIDPDVKILFLPPRTTSLLQPMDQGVIAALKSIYLRRTFTQAIESVQSKSITLTQFWKSFNILHAIKNAAAAWSEVTSDTLQYAWKKIYPDFFNKNEGQINSIIDIIERGVIECVSLAQALEIEVDIPEMEHFIHSAGEPLSNEELIKMQTLEILEEYIDEDDDDAVEEEKKKFTVKGLTDVFSHLEIALAQIEAMDEDEERYLTISSRIREEMAVYTKILKEKKNATKQLSMDSFVHML
ncbi:tigger transposable element-derived protein 1-like [Anopheles funestus]|uniref:tigger transposable element-derived protein 1-like n=1 Tax=Anopheles funestus TaxID=62324 RepID=UPI0020C5EEA5|nr:tigger transposable element-derived protein 1-like [Anopheles funestus]